MEKREGCGHTEVFYHLYGLESWPLLLNKESNTCRTKAAVLSSDIPVCFLFLLRWLLLPLGIRASLLSWGLAWMGAASTK